MNLTYSRSISLISPAATSRSSSSAFIRGNALAIDLPKLFSGKESIELIGLQLGDGFFLIPLGRIVDQSAAYPGSIRRIAASHCGLELIQPSSKAHGVTSLT